MSALRSAFLAAVAAAGFVTVTVAAAPANTTAGHPAPAYALCQEEDGSGPQTFPCFWNGGANGQGRSYVLVQPVCTPAQVAVSDAFHARGLADPQAGLCDDLESLTGEF
jgi:hypothetical protein